MGCSLFNARDERRVDRLLLKDLGEDALPAGADVESAVVPMAAPRVVGDLVRVRIRVRVGIGLGSGSGSGSGLALGVGLALGLGLGSR